MAKIVAVAQARIGSQRLPRKVLKEILGKPMLWHQVFRMSQSQLTEQVVIATAANHDNQDIVQFSRENDLLAYAGSEHDLIQRFLGAAELTEADILVRITADCPLVDSRIIDVCVEKFLEQDKYQFMTTYGYSGLPLGMDIEIFNTNLLRTLDKEISDTFKREWFTTNIFDDKERYGYGGLQLDYKEDFSNLRLTVDYPEDFQVIESIFKELHEIDKNFGLNDIIRLYKNNKDLFKGNYKYQQEDQKTGIDNALEEYRKKHG